MMRKLIITGCLALFAFPGYATDTTFEFHSGFWINLHHFLYEQATTDSLSPSYPPEWLAALAYYRREVIRRDLLADESAQINNRLSSLETVSSLKDSGLASEFIAILETAAPFYRTRWWPDHDRGNRTWMRDVAPLLSRYGDILRRELATIYATDWPSTPIRTDVVEYAKAEGAYTSLKPTHITVSSVNPGNQGEAALEILFHEASHALIVAKVRDTLSKEVRAQNKLFRRRDLWHAVLFYTAGELIRRQLDGYTPYADKHGLYDRTWPDLPEILETDWKPYLDGKIDLTTAVRRLVAAYSVSK
jgi:hypothetical protein